MNTALRNPFMLQEGIPSSFSSDFLKETAEDRARERERGEEGKTERDQVRPREIDRVRDPSSSRDPSL